MENRDPVVPANSRMDDSPANERPGLKTSPPPPKCSPVSSVSCLSLTSKVKQNDSKGVQFEEIEREEEKEIADILKRRLYDNAGTSDVYRSLGAQVSCF